MKQTYRKPEICVVKMSTQANILNMTSVGNEYNNTDVTYSRGSDDWDDED